MALCKCIPTAPSIATMKRERESLFWVLLLFWLKENNYIICHLLQISVSNNLFYYFHNVTFGGPQQMLFLK